ncbi:hypothetical protein B0H34DRAFT_856593 [Crassisporium funariophilum]|nr:hypothetical protein B0H34DRAFT_856593 [Crassisporium funariophilum]
MDSIIFAIQQLQNSASLKDSKGIKGVEDAIMQLSSTVKLLGLDTVSQNTFKRLSLLLRERLLPLYRVSLTLTLRYSIATLSFIHTDKVKFALDAKDDALKQSWEQLEKTLLSGILVCSSSVYVFCNELTAAAVYKDYLDEHPDAKNREAAAALLYPILCPLYFSRSSVNLSNIDGDLLSVVYQILTATAEAHVSNAAKLRDHVIGSTLLGVTLSQLRDFLAIESLLDLFGTLIPPVRDGREKRSQFIKNVFPSTLFKCSELVIQHMESITSTDWSVTAVKIMETLAHSDISFPQPFAVSSLILNGKSMNAISPFYVDKSGFLGNLDKDGNIETLSIPFSSTGSVAISASTADQITITATLTTPPVIGREPTVIPAGGSPSVSWVFDKKHLPKFVRVSKNRNLNLTQKQGTKHGSRKLSIAPVGALDSMPLAQSSTQDNARAYDKVWPVSTSPRRPGDSVTTSPLFPHTIGSTDMTAPVVIVQDCEGANCVTQQPLQPSTVFLDALGGLSLTAPPPQAKRSIVPAVSSVIDGDLSDLSPSPKQQPTMKVPHGAHRRIIVDSDEEPDESTQWKPTSKQKIIEISEDEQEQPIQNMVRRSSSKVIEKSKDRGLVLPSKTKEQRQRPHPPHSEIQPTVERSQLVPIDVDQLSDTANLSDNPCSIEPSRLTKRQRATASDTKLVPLSIEEPQINRQNARSPPAFDVKSKTRATRKRTVREFEDTEETQPSPAKRLRHKDKRQSPLPAPPYQRKRYGGRDARASTPASAKTVNFDEIPKAKLVKNNKEMTAEPSKARASAMKGKNGKARAVKAAPPKKKQEKQHQDVKTANPPATTKFQKPVVKSDQPDKVDDPVEIEIHQLVERCDSLDEDKGSTRRSARVARIQPLVAKPGPAVEGIEKFRTKTVKAPWEDMDANEPAKEFPAPICPTFALREPSIAATDHDNSNLHSVDEDTHSVTLIVEDGEVFQKDEEEHRKYRNTTPEVIVIEHDSPDQGIQEKHLPPSRNVPSLETFAPIQQERKYEEELSSPSYPSIQQTRDDRLSVSFQVPSSRSRRPLVVEKTMGVRKNPPTVPRSLNKTKHDDWEMTATDNLSRTSLSPQKQRSRKQTRYEQLDEPNERIVDILEQINQIVIDRVTNRFDLVRDELHLGQRTILEGTIQVLDAMHQESKYHMESMVALEAEYATRCTKVQKSLDDFRRSGDNLSQSFKAIVAEHSRQNLKRFPKSLFPKVPAVLMNPALKFKP